MNKKILLIVLVLLGILLLIASLTLVYREWAPSDDSAASAYYVSPNGNDANPGTDSAPFKTIRKADDTASSGDTVILKDGIYQGTDQTYLRLFKPGVTWVAQNRHAAIIDGGFAPEMLEGQWSNIRRVADDICGIDGDKGNSFRRLFSIDADNVTIDGIFLRNSCGGGFSLREGADNITIKNSKVDWTFVAGISIGAQPNNVNKNITLLNNEFTRISFNDRYASFVDGYCKPNEPERDYCVNVSWQLAGENLIIRDNLIAWGRGEISITGTRNVLFEDNIVIGNKNSFYSGNAHDVVVRNNLFWSPDSQLNPNTHWEKKGNQDNDWHISSRNEGGEEDNPQNEIVKGLDNVAFYNNLIINNGFEFNGYHTVDGNPKHSDSKNIYVGNNTFVGLPDTNGEPDKNLLFDISFGAKADADGDSEFTGIIENNIFDVSKERGLRFVIGLSGNDKVTLRNNVLPTDVIEEMRGPGDVYTADSVLQNAVAAVNFPIPAVGASTVDVAGLRTAINIDNYRLKNNADAINSGTTAGGEYGIEIPSLARSQDYFKNSRIGIPDIGAIEFGGVYHSGTPTPTPSITTTPGATFTPTPTGTPGPSLTPTLTRTPGPSPTITVTPSVTPTGTRPASTPTVTPTEPITGNVCGKADTDNNGIFDISDFAEFAQAYGDGRRSCGDSLVDYGPCRGRDADRDGDLDINDFGGYQIGFAQRYYPRTSCAL